jgi:hypothetical protein
MPAASPTLDRLPQNRVPATHARASSRAAVRVLAVPRAAAGSGPGGGGARWRGGRPALRPAGDYDSDPGPKAAFQRRRVGRGFGPLAGSGVQANGTWTAGCAVKGRRSLAWGEPEQPRSLRITGGSCHGGGPEDPPILQPPPKPGLGTQRAAKYIAFRRLLTSRNDRSLVRLVVASCSSIEYVAATRLRAGRAFELAVRYRGGSLQRSLRTRGFSYAFL